MHLAACAILSRWVGAGRVVARLLLRNYASQFSTEESRPLCNRAPFGLLQSAESDCISRGRQLELVERHAAGAQGEPVFSGVGGEREQTHLRMLSTGGTTARPCNCAWWSSSCSSSVRNFFLATRLASRRVWPPERAEGPSLARRSALSLCAVRSRASRAKPTSALQSLVVLRAHKPRRLCFGPSSPR